MLCPGSLQRILVENSLKRGLESSWEAALTELGCLARSGMWVLIDYCDKLRCTHDVGIIVVKVEQVLGPYILWSVVHSPHQLLADHFELLWSKQIVNDDNAIIDKGLDMA